MELSGLLKFLAYATWAFLVGFITYQLLPDFKRRAALARLGAAEGREPVRSPLLRMLKPILEGMAPYMAYYKVPAYRAEKKKQINAAGLGSALSVDELLAWKVLFALLWPAFLALISESARNPLVLLAVAAFFFIAPDFFIKDLVTRRQRQILRSLPFAVDLLTLCVEAGLDFSAGLARVVEKGKPGPLREELSVMLRDIRLGMTRADALRGLGERCDMVEVTSFTSVLIQADQLGASIGPVMRAQSERMRVERFQRAEKKGAEAATKILFPLVLFILPATFIIIVGPVILRFIYGLE
jgi:tight adherence protein C